MNRGAAAASIFVNPTQFGPNEDLAKYPRDEAGDIAKARTCGIDLAFCPDASVMYPAGAQTFIEVRELQKPLCGASRPGHFAGVATIVSKLFNITNPHLAVFGEKDYQQLAIIRRMVRDLDFGIEILGVPIVREADGLALSSRNTYLSPGERAVAPVLYRTLKTSAARITAGEPIAKVMNEGWLAIEEAGFAVDYFEARNAETLGRAETVADGPLRLLVAARIGKTRLIDNVGA